MIAVLLLMSAQAFAAGVDLSPKSSCEQKVKHTYFKFCYSKLHKQALWTFHKLTRKSIQGNTSRTNDYRFDPKVADPVDNTDYRGSGFDRGHLVPAADMKLNYQSMSETFFMTNMSPQRAGFNRAIWKQLEDGIRSQVRSLGDAFIVTAPVLSKKLPTIKSGVSIPTLFYKIAYFPKAKVMRAYLLENRKYSGASYSDFQVPVDEIEELTGIDFFAALPTHLQNRLESSID